jgi:HEAT repeat protein
VAIIVGCFKVIHLPLRQRSSQTSLNIQFQTNKIIQRGYDMLDQAFEALKTHDWGTDLKALEPITNAVVASRGDEAARKSLEARLAAALKTNLSRDAKDFLCRKLMLVGTADSVPTLAELLGDKDLAHMARVALEGIPAPEAAQALRDALPKLSGVLKAGAIASLGQRRDAASAEALGKALGDADPVVSRAAALALGAIRTADAAKALAAATASDPKTVAAVTDASLACAEGLLAAGNKGEALLIYKKFTGESQPKHVKLAATRGMLACAGK